MFDFQFIDVNLGVGIAEALIPTNKVGLRASIVSLKGPVKKHQQFRE